MQKKKWVRPELIILVRNQTEESVLQACKFFVPSGPGGVNGWCILPASYVECETIVSS